MIADLAFSFPWALAVLLALPGLWWLLKAVPPPPAIVRFPPLRLLMGLTTQRETPDHMPLWLLVLRALVVVALIVAAAGPVLHPDSRSAKTTGPLLIAFDDGWAAAADWQARRTWIEEKVDAAGRLGRSVYLVPTALPAPQTFGPFTAAQALTALHGWTPKPWETDRAATLKALQAIPTDASIESVWVSDGTEDGHSAAFIHALSGLGNGPAVIVGKTGSVLKPAPDGMDLSFEIDSLTSSSPTLIALDEAGRELGRTTTATLQLPLQMRNQVSRVVIEGDQSAGATVLMDERFRRRLVALVEDSSGQNPQPLLDSMTYVAKAVQPYAEIKSGSLADMMAQKPSVLVFDSTISPDQSQAVQDWIQAGGMAVRFAGNALTQNGDEPLLPVRLRAGGRTLGGVLSWAEPQQLAPFPADGPFAELPIPDETEVRSQVLAEPDLKAVTKVWARLTDGTPLVTAQPMGRGWLVLVHCAATPQWSSLPLSGLFPEMLHRLVMMSSSSSVPGAGPFNPVRVLDGLGILRPPGPDVGAIMDRTVAGPGHPPGFYGDPAAPMALNLGPGIGRLRPFVPPSGVQVSGLNRHQAEQDLRPAALLLALLLGLTELIVTSRLLRVAGLLLLTAMPLAQAETWEAGLDTRLAYVITGNAAIDRKSQVGLQALSQVLAARSTALLAAPQGVAPDSDSLPFYPLLYWPLTAGTETPTDSAVLALKRYLKRGGLIVFDRQDGGADDIAMNAALRRLNHALDLPALEPIPQDHVLTRSFYLIRTMPGRFTNGTVWVQANSAENDGVSTIVLGANDWAGAWAGQGTDASQREAALRFGINLCLYSLTGNYKADQVHMPAILERLGRQP